MKNRRTNERAAEEKIYGFGLIFAEHETVIGVVVVPRACFFDGVPLFLRAEVADRRNACAAPGNNIIFDRRNVYGNDEFSHDVDVAECTASDRRDACGNHGTVRSPNELVRSDFDESIPLA